MKAESDKSRMVRLITTQDGIKPSVPAGAERAELYQLSPLAAGLKTIVGTALFLGWLLLFILGLSLESGPYRKHLLTPDNSINWDQLLTYGLLFTPTNGAILASLAGILGGIASNLAANNKFRHTPPDLSDQHSDDFISYTYMTENPLVSMLRGFITYLIFIAGSYLTTFTSSANSDDPSQFLGLTASAYFKFAVSVSLLAYLAGYDPSRMKGLINSFSLTRKDPQPTTQGNVSAHIVRKETEINAQLTQGTPMNGSK